MSIIIVIGAFLASFLTLFSGFGLGTILMPVVAIFFSNRHRGVNNGFRSPP